MKHRQCRIPTDRAKYIECLMNEMNFRISLAWAGVDIDMDEGLRAPPTSDKYEN